MDGIADKLLRKLRQLAPHKVRAYDGSEESRDIAVPTRRKRWTQVIETLEAKAWVRVELLDKAGAVLGYIDNDGAPDKIEDIGPAGSQGNREKWLLELMLKAQDIALSHRDKEHVALLGGMRELLSVQTEAMKGVFQLLAIQRDVAADVADQRARLDAEEGAGDMGQVVKLLKEAPDLVKGLAPIIMAMQSRRQKPKAPNGEAKPEVKP